MDQIGSNLTRLQKNMRGQHTCHPNIKNLNLHHSSILTSSSSPSPKHFMLKRAFPLYVDPKFSHHHSESLSMLPIAFNPLGLFLLLFFSLTSYLSWHISVNHAPGLTKSKLLWMILALFLGR